MFLIEGQLLSQEQDFCAQSRARTDGCLRKTHAIADPIAEHGDSL
jgi:hypothetical protein